MRNRVTVSIKRNIVETSGLEAFQRFGGLLGCAYNVSLFEYPFVSELQLE